MSATHADYSPLRAWTRASVYFGVCILLGGITGTINALFSAPFGNSENLGDTNWYIWTALCIGIIYIGYVIIWPRGTLTHGRPLEWAAVIPFGLAWGISEGILFATVWRLLFGILGQSIWTVLVAFIILAAFIGLWHQFYWDIYVAPEHNIEEWNLRKVAFAHTPNLIACLIYLTLYQSLGVFVALQTFALLASTIFMHFPSFWREAQAHG